MTKINTCGYVNQYFQEAEKMLTLICIQAIMTTRKMSKYRTHVLQFIIGHRAWRLHCYMFNIS